MDDLNKCIIMVSLNICSTVAPVIEFLDPEQLTILSPNNAVYNCRATARPRPSITWYMVDSDGNRTALMNTIKYIISVAIIPSREREVISILSVTNTDPSDTADYVCEANNVVSTTEGNVSLTVHGMWENVGLILCLYVNSQMYLHTCKHVHLASICNMTLACPFLVYIRTLSSLFLCCEAYQPNVNNMQCFIIVI